MNRYAMIPRGFRGCLGRRLALVRPDSAKVNPKFLFYYFFGEEWRQTISKNTLIGSTVDRIPLTTFPEFEISLPPPVIQNKIAAVLSAYDDLIENNLRRIKILEEMAQMIYREWFVNFRFPGHEKVKMVKSELGLIPEGWTSTSLQAIVDNKSHAIVDGPFGSQMKVSEYVNTGIPIIEMPHLEGFYFYGDFQNYITGEKYEQVKRSTAKSGDIVMSKTGTLGLLGIVPEQVDRAVIVSRLAKISPSRTRHNKFFLFFFLKRLTSEGYWNNVSSGSTMPMLNLDHIKNVRTISPPVAITENFDELIEPLYKYITNLLKRNVVLRQTRDLLLPRLINGEIDVEGLNIKVGDDGE